VRQALEIELPYGGDKIVASEIPDEDVYYIPDRSEAPALRELRSESRKA